MNNAGEWWVYGPVRHPVFGSDEDTILGPYNSKVEALREAETRSSISGYSFSVLRTMSKTHTSKKTTTEDV